MHKTIRVGVFGAGNFANNQHLPNLSKIDGVEIVAVCDLNEEAARETANRFDIPRIYTDGHEMLDREPMDAMWSIVPAYARTDVEVTAATKGIHLFSEKPQALEMKVARRIDEAVRGSSALSASGSAIDRFFRRPGVCSKTRRSSISASKAFAICPSPETRTAGAGSSRKGVRHFLIGGRTPWIIPVI